MTAQIFLSYARPDREQVEGLYQKLLDTGFRPWMDKRDILPGESWKSRIPQAIRGSDFFLVCLSANSTNKRGWIQKEIKQALDIWQEKLDSDIYLIPVRLEGCETPESLRDFQWVNLFEEDGWKRLVRAIEVGVERRIQAPKVAAQELRSYEAHSPSTNAPSSAIVNTSHKVDDSELKDSRTQQIDAIEKQPPMGRATEGQPSGTLSIAGNTLLQKYKILGSLGSGTFGDVYLAEDMELKRKVAVKQLKIEYAANEDVLERFRKEARTVAGLRHQNIAVVYGMDRENDQSYIVLEYAEKGTLADLVKERPLPITLAIDLAIALCHALTAVHKQGIFHRDIKPGNILLIASEDTIIPKLSDFGLASGSQSDRPISTPQYTSPEQLDGELGDARSDIYSLGAVLYEMLMGKPPFTRKGDEGLQELPEQIPPALRNSRKEILPSLERIVLKAVAHKPAERYQTARAMAADLEVARREQVANDEKVRSLYSQVEQFRRAQDWPMALRNLEEISTLNPTYEHTAQWIEDATVQIALQTKYDQGLAACDRKDWNEAQQKFKEIVETEKTYRDAADRLKEVEKQVHLHSLYEEAERHEDNQDWSGAIQKYAQIISIDSGYEDTAQKLAMAGERNRLKLLYDQANALFTEKRWTEALAKFQEILASDPHYEDGAATMEKAKRHARSEALYAEGMECLNNSNWQGAISRFSDISRADSGYEAVDARLTEAERQKRLQGLYDQGVTYHGRKDWQRAIERFTQVLSENPQHETAVKLLEEAKWRRTQAEAMTKPGKKSLIKAWGSSQDPAMKAALIGLIGVCSVLGVVFLGIWLSSLNPPGIATETPAPGTPSPSPTVTVPPTPSSIIASASATDTPAVTLTLRPSPTVTIPPTSTNRPSPTNTPVAIAYPTPMLVSPKKETSFPKGENVKLVWEWENSLSENEFFEVRIRPQGKQKFDQWGLTKLPYQILTASDLSQTGLYEWQIAVASLLGEEKSTSQIWSFEVR